MAQTKNVRSSAGLVPVMSTPGFVPTFPRVSTLHQQEIGGTGTAFMTGIIVGEEHKPELDWKEKIRTYDVMVRTDPQIFSTLLMCELPIRSAEWKVAPGTPAPRDLEIASLAETALFHTMERPFDDILRHALLMLRYGFSVFEQTWQTVNGYTLLRDLSPRLAKTIYRWWVDERNKLKGIQQWVWKGQEYQYLDIPEETLVMFTHRQEGDNYEGVSLLRSSYKPWWYKQQYEKIQAVGYEREHVGIPVITLPEGYKPTDIARADRIGKNLRSHEQSWVTLFPGWTVEWLKSKSSERKGSTMLETMYYLDRQIQQNILAQFMSLGTTDVGSYALSNDQSRVFLMSLQAHARSICDVFNRKTLRPLVDYNYRDVAIYPQLVTQRIHAYNFMDVVVALADLVNSGVIPVTHILEDYVYDLLGIPMAPKNVIEAINPVGADTTGIPGTHISDGSENTNPAAGSIGFHEVYVTHAFDEMTGPQKAIYTRMARDAGRPVITLARGDYRFVSAAEPAPRLRGRDRQNALQQRRNLLAANGAASLLKQNYEALVDEMESVLGEME